MLLNIEKPGQQDKERSSEWLVNTGPELPFTIRYCVVRTPSKKAFENIPGKGELEW